MSIMSKLASSITKQTTSAYKQSGTSLRSVRVGGVMFFTYLKGFTNNEK